MPSLTDFKIILASKSPRRKFLLEEIGINFEVRTKETDETFPEDLKAQNIPLYLAQKKAEAFVSEIKDDEIIIAADTIVWLNNAVLNKPAGFDNAVQMLKQLAGNMHEVFTGVCLMSKQKTKLFFDQSKVYFKKVSDEEIKKYVTNFSPYDKAGAYGAQECLPEGMNPCSAEEIKFLASLKKENLIQKSINKRQDVASEIVERIEGSYFNVMGLPLCALHRELLKFSGY